MLGARDPLLRELLGAADVDHADLAAGDQRPRLLGVDLLRQLPAVLVLVRAHLEPPPSAFREPTYTLIGGLGSTSQIGSARQWPLDPLVPEAAARPSRSASPRARPERRRRGDDGRRGSAAGGGRGRSENVESMWAAVLDWYRSGVHPALQVCVRRNGAVILDRAIGHAPRQRARRRRRRRRRSRPRPRRRSASTRPRRRSRRSSSTSSTSVACSTLDDPVAKYIPGYERNGKEGDHDRPRPGPPRRRPQPAARASLDLDTSTTATT